MRYINVGQAPLIFFIFLKKNFKKPIDKSGFIVYNLIRKREKERNKKMMYDEMVARAKAMTVDQLKDAQFINNMIDHWTSVDRMWNAVLHAELMARQNAK